MRLKLVGRHEEARVHGNHETKERELKNHLTFPKRLPLRTALLGLLAFAGCMTPSQADNGGIQIVLTKAEFIVGIQGGSGVLSFQGNNYPLSVGGVSLGADIGISTTQLTGTVSNLFNPADIQGSYVAGGGSAAVIVGASVVQLQNQKGVTLNLSGPSYGLNFTLDVNGLTLSLR